eukprot:1674817-Rhodomonas_salina.2
MLTERLAVPGGVGGSEEEGCRGAGRMDPAFCNRTSLSEMRCPALTRVLRNFTSRSGTRAPKRITALTLLCVAQEKLRGEEVKLAAVREQERRRQQLARDEERAREEAAALESKRRQLQEQTMQVSHPPFSPAPVSYTHLTLPTICSV